MTNTKGAYRNRPVLSTEDIEAMLSKADTIADEYRRLRVKALIGLLKIFGKRRSEIARLKITDLTVNDSFLTISWTISKKHKRGIHQYIKAVKTRIIQGELPSNYLADKSYIALVNEHRAWTQTQAGFRLREDTRNKKVALDNPFCRLITDYLDFTKTKYPEATFLFPRCIYCFGALVRVDPNNHLSGSQILRLIKGVDDEAWCHLFRETKGAEIARKYGNDLAGITKVRDTLDLEEEATAYRYTRRYAVQEMELTP